MTRSFTIEGIDEFLALMESYGPAALQVGLGALNQEAENIMTVSKTYVPVLDGTLRSTGHVIPPVIEGSRAVVQLAYGGAAAPYALAVHENPRAGRTGGISPRGRRYRRWAKTGTYKYLERAVLEAIPGLAERLAERLKAAFVGRGPGGAPR